LGACASIAGTTVQNELAQELKLQEFQESLKKVEKASMDNLTPELKASMDELREAAESMKRSYSVNDPEKASDEANTIHNPVVKRAKRSERCNACQRRASGRA
jgi:sec-independent protein translocase protein TatB